jgi:hypothetical protein
MAETKPTSIAPTENVSVSTHQGEGPAVACDS